MTTDGARRALQRLDDLKKRRQRLRCFTCMTAQPDVYLRVEGEWTEILKDPRDIAAVHAALRVELVEVEKLITRAERRIGRRK